MLWLVDVLLLALLALPLVRLARLPAAPGASTGVRLALSRVGAALVVLGVLALLAAGSWPAVASAAWLAGVLTLSAGAFAASLVERAAAARSAPLLGAAAVACVSTLAAALALGNASHAQALGTGGVLAALENVTSAAAALPAALLAAGLAWGLPAGVAAVSRLGRPDPYPIGALGALVLTGLVAVPGFFLIELICEGAGWLDRRLGDEHGVPYQERPMRPDEVLHITTREAWERARADGSYAPASLAAEGFIHLSSPAQLAGTASRYYRGQRDLIVLVLDPARVEPGALRWEPSTGGELFPHLYRAIDPAEVVAVRPLEPPP